MPLGLLAAGFVLRDGEVNLGRPWQELPEPSHRALAVGYAFGAADRKAGPWSS